MALSHATLHSSASSGITGCWMHQIPLLVLCPFFFFIMDALSKYCHVLEMGMHMQAGVWWFYGQKWVVPIFSTVVPPPDCVSFVLWPLCPSSLTAWTPLLRHLTSLPSSTFPDWFYPFLCSKCVPIFRHLYSQLSQWYLWLVLEGLQGADKWECRLFASIYNMQKRFSTSVDSISACSGSFVLVTFSQLNENPPQRLMQPEAVREVQTHLLSSLSDLPTIFQSWQDGNKGSRTRIAVRSSFTRKGGLLTSDHIPHFLRAVLRCLLSPSIPFFPRSFTLQEDGSLPLLYCLFL